ncbi:DUF2684 family protein [Citrobacter rodentium]|uniref:DUF2684 family protein n=2 Tax=Citrobacter rodentium TaxID=67825 RepID=A0A482PK55_CITRO|nr:DUF2684 family protein [Citrobacter rodentium]
MQVSDTGSLSVNQYGWINIWMAILGHFFTRFPAFFETARIELQTQGKIFTDNDGNLRIYVLLFHHVVGIKRGARLIIRPASGCIFAVAFLQPGRNPDRQKAHGVFFVSPLPAGLKLLLWLRVCPAGRPWR